MSVRRPARPSDLLPPSTNSKYSSYTSMFVIPPVTMPKYSHTTDPVNEPSQLAKLPQEPTSVPPPTPTHNAPLSWCADSKYSMRRTRGSYHSSLVGSREGRWRARHSLSPLACCQVWSLISAAVYQTSARCGAASAPRWTTGVIAWHHFEG